MLSLRFCGALLLLSSPVWAAGTKINGVTYADSGTVVPPLSTKDALPPDQALRLKKIFLFPSIDDVSGALAPKLDDKIAELFRKNTRFELIRDPQVLKALSPDESSYAKAAINQDVHKEAARVVGADTTVLLRTRNLGSNTQFTLELRDARGNFLFIEEGMVPGASSMDARWALIEKLYRAMLSRLPFEGTITGRTAGTLTVDLGMGSIKAGEEIEIARIVSAQRHPLLGTVVGTDYVRTGRAKVTTVDRVLSFAEVLEENPGEKISPGNKVLLARTALIKRGSKEMEPEAPRKGFSLPKSDEADAEPNPLDDETLKGDFDKPKPRYGMVSGNLYYGSMSNLQSQSGVVGDYSGSGIGGDVNGELWVTRNWIGTALLGFQSANLSGATASIGSSSFQNFEMAVGYRIFPEALAEGVTLTGGVGYQVARFDIPSNAALGVGNKRYSGIQLKADAEIAFMQQQTLSVGFGISPFSSLTQDNTSLGTPSGATVISLHLAWNKELMNSIWLKLGIRYLVANGNFDNSNTVSNKRFAIGPGLYYLF